MTSVYFTQIKYNPNSTLYVYYLSNSVILNTIVLFFCLLFAQCLTIIYNTFVLKVFKYHK